VGNGLPGDEVVYFDELMGSDPLFLTGNTDTVRVDIPGDVPATNFWSVVVYDPQTGSVLQAGQRLVRPIASVGPAGSMVEKDLATW
jgi:hypothetical protein